MSRAGKSLVEFISAILVFIGIMYLVRFTNLDLKISDAAFNLTAFNSSKMLTVAAWIGKYMSVIFCSVVILALPWLWKTDHKFKKEATFAIFLLAVGPGFMNNFIFKPYFKRPRPFQIERYNDQNNYKYTPPLVQGTNRKHTSFPSGHARAAFFFIFPWFCLRYRREYGIRLIIPGFIFGLITGSIRIMEGNHFFSDIMASLAVVYLTGTVLSYLLFSEDEDFSKKLS